MYKVFYNHKPIFLTTQLVEFSSETPFLFIKYTSADKILQALKSKKTKAVYLYHPKQKKLEKHFRKYFPEVVAAGGLVEHKNGKLLFIYRNNQWDLPKGRVEGKETIPVAAVREVEEETGVGDLILQKPLLETFHLFKRNGKYKLKRTHWYKMTTTYEGPVVPQIDEGIQKVVWVDPKKVPKLLKKGYANISLLFENGLV
ncbi:MAG: NUDIX hydrolase [Flavobacteriaceae bacterium]